LEEKILHLLERLEKARAIALNGIDTFRDRYLKPAAQACYWRRIFKGWAEAVNFVPATWETDQVSGFRKVRGVPFETFS